MPEYEIYALRFAGPFTSSSAFLMWLRDWAKVEKRNYYIWCIKGAGKTVVVYTGVSPSLAKERNLAGYISPAEVLSKIDRVLTSAFIAISDLSRSKGLSMRDAALVIAIDRVVNQCRERGWL